MRKWFLLCAQFPLAAALLASPGDDEVCAIEEAQLEGTGVAAAFRYGDALAVDGNTAVVGAWSADVGGVQNTGAAYVFERVGSQWEETQRLVRPNREPGDQFGFDVDIDGDTIVVGARRAGSSAVTDEGAVYVFSRQGTAWSLVQELTPPAGPGTSDWFGASLEIDGDLLAIGAPNRQPAGAVFVYERSGTTWERDTALAGDPGVGFNFGIAVALSGTRVVGAIQRNFDTSLLPIHVRRPSGSWELETELTHPIPDALDTYGLALAMDGDTLLVGAAGVDNSPDIPGSVYVYTFASGAGTWLLSGELQAVDGIDGDMIGTSVALDRDMAVVGAKGADEEAGVAYVFTRSAPFTWAQNGRISSPLPGQDAEFGDAVAISKGTILVGAERADAPEIVSGAAWAFSLTPIPSEYCTPKANSLGCLPTLAFSGTPSATMTSGFQITAVDVRNQKPGLLLYGFEGPAALPFQGGTLCVAGALERSVPVSSGGNPPPFNDCSGVLRLDWNAFSAGLLGGNPRAELRISGTPVNAQWWGRDQGGSFNSMLSDAIEFTMCQ